MIANWLSPAYLLTLAALATFIAMVLTGKLPRIESWQGFLDSFETKGGQLMLLWVTDMILVTVLVHYWQLLGIFAADQRRGAALWRERRFSGRGGREGDVCAGHQWHAEMIGVSPFAPRPIGAHESVLRFVALRFLWVYLVVAAGAALGLTIGVAITFGLYCVVEWIVLKWFSTGFWF